MKNYEHLEGLAEIAKDLDRSHVGVWMQDYGALTGTCDYCGARIRYKNHFEDGKTSIGIGSCCAANVFKYMQLPPEMVSRVISYFKKYQELANKAKVDPVAKLTLEDLDQSISNLKKKIEESKQKLAKSYADEINDLLNTRFVTDWERDFLSNCLLFMTQKMEALYLKIRDEIKARGNGDEILKNQVKLSYLYFEGKYKIYAPIYDIFSDMYRRNLTHFSEKQQSLIDKHLKILVSKNPDGWNFFVNQHAPLRIREALKKVV